MEKLIRNNDIILDGTATRYEKEQAAFIKLSQIETLLERYEVNDLKELETILKNGSISHQYRQIEKELGVKVPTLFDLMKANHIYTKDGEYVNDGIQYNEKRRAWCICAHKFDALSDFFKTMKLQNYKKEWALSEEELKK